MKELRTRIIKDVEATSGDYTIKATVHLENGQVSTIFGNASKEGDMPEAEGIVFSTSRINGKLKTSYNNISEDEREVIAAISELVDNVIAAYHE